MPPVSGFLSAYSIAYGRKLVNAIHQRKIRRYEAVELRDGDKGTYLGNSVARAVKNVNEKISEALIGMDPTLQSQIDQAMIDLDKTEKKVIVFSSFFSFSLQLV